MPDHEAKKFREARRSRKRSQRLLAPMLAAVAFSAALASPALAAPNWTVGHAADESVTLFGISCPSASLCVAVGSNDTIATSTDPTGGAAAWSVVHPDEGTGPTPLSNQIRGVSCPSIQFCVAAGPQGRFYTSTDPTGSASAWNLTVVGEEAPQTHVYGISCASPSLCVAVANFSGRIITSTDPTGGSSAWKVGKVGTAEEDIQLRGVSCPSASLCVAVGRAGYIPTSTDPTGDASAWEPVTKLPGIEDGIFNGMSGVSCPSLSLCVTGNEQSNILTSTNPTGGASGWKEIDGGSPFSTPLAITAVSCPSPSECAMVDENADVMTSTDPTGGPAAWSFTNVIPVMPGQSPANGMFGISCPSKSLCAAAGQAGQIITSIEPFGTEPTAAKHPTGGRPKRPGVKITRHPRARLTIKKAKTEVHFRFRAIGRATGFQCKLDSAKFSRCHSPKSYKVRPGKHTFKVKAFGPGGIARRAATFRFGVIHR